MGAFASNRAKVPTCRKGAGPGKFIDDRCKTERQSPFYHGIDP